MEVLPPGASVAQARHWSGQWSSPAARVLAEEVPVALVFNGVSHAVMMATPADLEDFALGFALTEGLIDHAAELYGVEQAAVAEGIELKLEVSAACAWRLRERRRTLPAVRRVACAVPIRWRITDCP